MNNKPCMFFEDFDLSRNIRYKRFKATKKGDITTFNFGMRIRKGCIFKYWNSEKTDFVMLEVVASFTNMGDSSKNIIELKKL